MSTPPEQDHYAVLGLTPTATAAEIARAYRRLLRNLHPDTAPVSADGTESLRTVVVAHQVLGDPERRAEYDRRRRPGPGGAAEPAPGPARSHSPGPPAPIPQSPIRVGPVRYHGPVRNSPAPPDRSPGSTR